ncbi:UDP-N-acetylmuramate--L-alanine ligase [Bacteroidia bacterium]|nr:UDP-N-acetylmuramate--L-alanine ligase [Bacteroidia bacterium]
MRTLSTYRNAYFLGIGGIGMSAIARYLLEQGIQVFGYDKTKTKITEDLINLGAEITFSDAISKIPLTITDNLTESLFIITPAIPSDHPQKIWLNEHGIEPLKRSEVLGLITQNTICLAVAGTHGKTTTSTLLAHILKENNINFSAFLGGISSNYNTNYVTHNGGVNLFNLPITIVEADEFDRSFHRLKPSAAIVTSMDADHLDIYESTDAFNQAFEHFIELVEDSIEHRPNIFIHESVELKFTNSKAQSYGTNTDNQNRYSHVNIIDGRFYFEFDTDDQNEEYVVGLPGYHNIANATAAISLCYHFLNVPLVGLKAALKSFKGVYRRFEFLVRNDQCIVIDDYAHHPTELKQIIHSVKNLFPKKQLTVVFQPHLFSRTRDFANEFASELREVDILKLLDIYPAREVPIEGIDSNWLHTLINHKDSMVIGKPELLKWIKEVKPELLLILGAGDVDQLREPIIKIYE